MERIDYADAPLYLNEGGWAALAAWAQSGAWPPSPFGRSEDAERIFKAHAESLAAAFAKHRAQRESCRDVWLKVMTILSELPIDFERVELDAEYARRIPPSGEHEEILGRASSDIARAAKSALEHA